MKLNKHKTITIVQWGLILVFLVIMMSYEVGVLFYIVAFLIIIIVPLSLSSVSYHEKTIEVFCDVDKYLKEIGKSRTKKEKLVYPIKKAFALIHKNELDAAEEAMNAFELTTLEKSNKVYRIYIMVKARLYFEKKSVEELKGIEEELLSSKKPNESVLEYVKAYRSILQDDALTAIESLKEAIPKQLHRLEIYELEYQLAKLYLETEQYNDSAFVADFISEKKYEVLYVEWCKEISKEAHKHLE